MVPEGIGFEEDREGTNSAINEVIVMVAEEMEAGGGEVDTDTEIDETIIELEEFEKNEGMGNIDSDPQPPVPVNVGQDKTMEGTAPPEPTIHVTGNEREDDASLPRGPKGRAPKSETTDTSYGPEPLAQPPPGLKSKHSFLKHTEEVTKMSEGFKEKEQEEISKDAFFQSPTASQVTGGDAEIGDTLQSTLGLGKDRAKPLGEERTNDDDVANVAPPCSIMKKTKETGSIPALYPPPKVQGKGRLQIPLEGALPAKGDADFPGVKGHDGGQLREHTTGHPIVISFRAGESLTSFPPDPGDRSGMLRCKQSGAGCTS